MDKAKRIKEIIQKDLLASVVASKAEIEGEPGNPDALKLDVHDDGAWSVLDGDFEYVTLRENPLGSVKKVSELSFEVRPS